MAELNNQSVRHKSNKLPELCCRGSMRACVYISTCLTCLALNHRLCDLPSGTAPSPICTPPRFWNTPPGSNKRDPLGTLRGSLLRSCCFTRLVKGELDVFPYRITVQYHYKRFFLNFCEQFNKFFTSSTPRSRSLYTQRVEQCISLWISSIFFRDK